MNKVMLIGYVGKDPDVRYYDADQAVAQVSFATTERGYTLPNGTQVPDHTDWHNLVFFRALAKYVEKYVRKGDRLYVEGKLRYRMYDDKSGKRKYVTEIYVDNLEFLNSKMASSSHANNTSAVAKPASESVNSRAGANGSHGTAEEENQDGLPF